ncbi:MAG: SurA N-terminal domain-containing protein [bacterium]
MPKSKKTVKKTASKVVPIPSEFTELAAPIYAVPPKRMNNKIISLALAAVVIGLLVYKFGPWLVPAVIDNRPVTRFELWSRLEKNYGTQALDDIVNEKILDKAISDAHVKVDEAKVSDQIKSLEKQFETTGGLDEALKQRGLTRQDLEKQVRTQLSVEELLADKINPSDEEVQKQFDAGATTTYKDQKFDTVKDSIKEELKQTKLRDAFLAWFADVKKDIKVKSFGL